MITREIIFYVTFLTHTQTYSARALGTKFKHFIEINFEETPDARLLFKDGLSAAILLEKISAFTGQSIITGDTLLFFDEVQGCPEALAAL